MDWFIAAIVAVCVLGAVACGFILRDGDRGLEQEKEWFAAQMKVPTSDKTVQELADAPDEDD